jgi:maltose alpha-D-glucosyltransferase/alpha-amylase
VTLLRSKRFNSSLVFGSQYILKTFWRIEEGVNPELEIGSFLWDRQHFEYVAPLLDRSNTGAGTPRR